MQKRLTFNAISVCAAALIASGLIVTATACGSEESADTGAASAGITETVRSFADHQDIDGSQQLVCQSQRVTSTDVIRDVRDAETQTGVPMFKPFPPDDKDYEDFLSAYREVSIPSAAVSIGEEGDSAYVDVAKIVDNRVFVDTGSPISFRKDSEGKWLFCDNVVLSKESVTETAKNYLVKARERK